MIFVFEPREAQRVFNSNQKLVGGQRLFQEIERAEFRCADGHFDVCLARNQNHRSLHSGVFDFFQKFQAVLSRHHHIRKDEIEFFRAQQVDSPSRAITNGSFVSCKPECTRKRCQSIDVVVHEKEMSFSGHGAFRTRALSRSPPRFLV